MNADKGLTVKERLLWMVRAFNRYISSTFCTLNVKPCRNYKVTKTFSRHRASPTRMYTENLIFRYIPWEKIKSECGKVVICEFGCGDFRYLDLYDEILGEGNYYYLGIEAPNFQLSDMATARLSDKVRFINFDLNNGVPEDIETSNVFLSFSVFEHVDNLECMLEWYRRRSKYGSFHFHSVPTFFSVFNYLWHRCRHFNKLDIKNLALPNNSQKTEVIYYGGIITIFFHFVFITSLDVISKFVTISEPIRSKGDFCARKVVSFFQTVDDLSSRFGVHSFALVSWRTK